MAKKRAKAAGPKRPRAPRGPTRAQLVRRATGAINVGAGVSGPTGRGDSPGGGSR